MPEIRHASPGGSPAGRRRHAPAWIILSAGVLLGACDEPTLPTATLPAPNAAVMPGESGALLSRLAALGPALADEADRLLPAVGERYSEQPLRLALRTLRQRVTQDDAAALDRVVVETRGLVRSYRPEAGGVDPAELDALELLIASVEDVLNADRTEAVSLEGAADIKGARRPS
jgi:hypothetical protein